MQENSFFVVNHTSRASVLFDRPGYGRLMQNFLLGIYIFFTIRYGLYHQSYVLQSRQIEFLNFRIIAFIQNFEFKLNFSNSSNFEIFSEKVPKIMKNFVIFF